jgi:hypothetical protein
MINPHPNFRLNRSPTPRLLILILIIVLTFILRTRNHRRRCRLLHTNLKIPLQPFNDTYPYRLMANLADIILGVDVAAQGTARGWIMRRVELWEAREGC